MTKKILNFTIAVLICFTFTDYSIAKNEEVTKSPLKRSTRSEKTTISNLPEQEGIAYLEMDGDIYHDLKQKIKSKKIRSISDFPLYADTSVTIENINEVKTFAENTMIFHGDKPINRTPDILAIKGKIAESGDSIFLTLSPRGAYGFTRDANGKHKRSLKYSPNSTQTLSYDTTSEDIQNLNLMNDMVGKPFDPEAMSEQSDTAKGLDVMSYYRIAVETTARFLENKFKGDTEAAEDYIFAIFAYINPPFNEFNAHLYVNYIRLWPNGNDGYKSTGLRNLLSEFSSRWRWPDNPEYSIPRHTAIILSMLRDSAAVGWGSTDTICNKNGNSAAYQGYSSMYISAMIVAHELGHVFGSGHTWDYDPPIEECTIMSYCNTEDNFVFHPRVIELFNSLHSQEEDNCVPLTNPNNSDCSAPEISVTGTSINSISLVWYNTEAVDNYTVSYMPSGASDWTIAAEGLAHSNYLLSGLDQSTTYTIRVQSNCSDGAELSNTITVSTGTCTAPTVTVTDTFIDSITLSWDDEGVNNYSIMYKKEGASNWTTATAEFDEKMYQLSDLTDETTYTIRVYSHCPDGSQPYTELTETTDEIKECITPVVSVTDISTSTISISWNDAGADSYNVYCKESGATSWSTKALNLKPTSFPASFPVSYLDKNTTYDIIVVCNCQDGSTINSNNITETTDELENSCSKAEITVTETSANSVSLSWQDTGTVSPDSYDILYKNVNATT